MKKIPVYKDQATGRVVILGVAPKEHVAKILPHVAAMTDDEFLDFVINKDVPANARHTVKLINENNFPSDRAHRDEWDFSDDGKSVSPDQAKVAAKIAKQDKDRSLVDSVSDKITKVCGLTDEEIEVYKKITGNKK